MKRFRVDAGNRVVLADYATAPENVGESNIAFESEEQLSEMTALWATARLIQMFNGLPKVNRVTRFTNRKTAIRRIWKAVQTLKPTKTSVEAGANSADGTKKAKLIELLNNTGGTTIAELMAATDWQKHSIRGFLSGTVVRRMGLRLSSFKRDGERVYRIG